jgi:hypothetical protein
MMTNTGTSTSYEYTLASTSVSQNLSLPIASLGVPNGNYNMFLRYVRPVSEGGANIDSSTVTNITLEDPIPNTHGVCKGSLENEHFA